MVVAISEERGIHNGAPSLHALCLSECEPQVGEDVVHIGAGTGYYTAILAAMVQPTGSVTAFEIEPDLAARAATNVPTARVRAESAIGARLPLADVIYVNAVPFARFIGTRIPMVPPGAWARGGGCPLPVIERVVHPEPVTAR